MDRRNAVLRTQFRKITEIPNEFLKFHMEERDMSTWYVLLSGIAGDNNEYVGGEYVVKIVLPNDYPYNPPEFYFLTPQGLFELNTTVCVSIGQFHAKDYRPVLGIAGFCTNLISGLIGWKTIGDGIAIIKTTLAEKKKLAAESRSYNTTYNAEIMKKINESFAAYSARWPQSKPMEAKNTADISTQGD